jgi:hypothetical protein
MFEVFIATANRTTGEYPRPGLPASSERLIWFAARVLRRAAMRKNLMNLTRQPVINQAHLVHFL